MSRIDFADSWQDILVKLVEGNPGALEALLGFLKRHPEDGLVHLCKLDDNQIYGPRIWLLWKDLCHFNAEQFDHLIFQNGIYKMSDLLSQTDISLREEWNHYGTRIQ